MKKVTGIPIDIGVKLDEPHIIEEGSNQECLFIILQCHITSIKVKIKFIGDVIGYRVLDECNLLEYWPICNTKSGNLFEILSGGWLEQESKREGFIARHSNSSLKEYFISGNEDCVSVISGETPIIEVLN